MDKSPAQDQAAPETVAPAVNLSTRLANRVLPTPVRRVVRRTLGVPTRLRYALAAGGVWANENHRLLGALRGKHAGQRVFLIGGGPSIREQDLHLMRGEVTIAFNTFFNTARQLGWMPTYYLVEDPFGAEDNRDELNALQGTTKIFAHDLRSWLKPDPRTIYVCFDRYYADFPSRRFPRFSPDASRVVYWGGTVTYMGLQLAYFFSAKEIYMMGMDLSFNAPTAEKPGAVFVSTGPASDHAHPDDFRAGMRRPHPRTDRMQRAIEFGSQWLWKRGVAVYNATRGGQLQGVPRKNYEELFV